MRRPWGLSVLALSFVLGVTTNTLAGDPPFTTIDFPGAVATFPRDINSAGDIVGHYRDAAGEEHGFQLSQGTFTTIDFPNAAFNAAVGISPGGDIVGIYVIGGTPHGYLLRDGEFTTIDFPGAAATSATGINKRGDIVGSYCLALRCPLPGNRGFLLSQGKFTKIDFPGAIFTRAWKISPGGDIVGDYIDVGGGPTKSGSHHGFVLSDGEYTSIDVDIPGTTGTVPLGVNGREDIVGAYCDALPCGDAFNNHHAFLLSQGEFRSFDFPGAQVGTNAFAINAGGDIVGDYCVALPCPLAGNVHGFLRTTGERDEDPD